MILKSLHLKIGDLGLPSSYTYDFKKKSRYMCNYIEREVLKKLRFKTDGFNRIVVSLKSEPTTDFFLYPAKVACTDIPFEQEIYDALMGERLTDFLILKTKEGIENVAAATLIPKEEIYRGLDAFVINEYVNEWLYKKRSFKQHSLVVYLYCKLTQSGFTLVLKIIKNDVVVFEEIILETDPDEVAFHYRFKDIIIEDGQLVITSKISSQNLFTKKLSTL